MIITLGGASGSGKTTVARLLSETLGMKFYSMGGLRGKLALEKGLTLDELNKLGEQDETTDTSVDYYQRDLGKTDDNFVVDGHVSWFFIPHSFKIFLKCDPMESARRIFHLRHTTEDRHDEPDYKDLEHTSAAIEERRLSDQTRYQKYYNIEDHRDPKHFDLVIDTTNNGGPEQTLKTVLQALKEKGLLK